jgi:hypothetical protein
VHVALDLRRVGGHALQRGVVVPGPAEREQLRAVAQAALDGDERLDRAVEVLFLPPERLGAPGVRPDLRIFELAADLYAAQLLGVEVKDTSSARRTVAAGRRAGR